MLILFHESLNIDKDFSRSFDLQIKITKKIKKEYDSIEKKLR